MIRFLKEPTIVSVWLSALIVVVAGVLMWEFGPSNSIGFMRLKVVNDLTRTVQIQPCWDVDCRQTGGLATVILRPGEGKRIDDAQFENDIVQLISIAVQKPGAGDQEFEGCVVRGFYAQTKVGVLRVARQTLIVCPTLSEGGAGGG